MSSLNKNNVLSEALNWDGELLADIQNALKEKLREMDANANGGVSSISLSDNGSNQLVVEVTRADGTKRAASYDVSNMIGGGGSVVMGRIVDGLFYPATKIEGGNAYADTPLTNPDTGKLYIDMPHGNIYRYNPNLSDPWDRMSNIAVDGTLSSTSTNPISNKAVTLALEDKLEAGDIAGKADKLAGMLHPAQWPKVVILNVSGNTIFQAQTGDVFFDAGILYLQTSSTENTPIGAPQEGILYYCLADNKTYYWRGNSWHQAGGSGNGTVQSVSVNGGQPQYPNGQTGNVNLIVEAGAQGPKGDTGNVQVDGNGNVLIVNSLTEGGTGAALSAEMGKRLAMLSGTFAAAWAHSKVVATTFCWLWQESVDGSQVCKPIWHVGNSAFVDAAGAVVSVDAPQSFPAAPTITMSEQPVDGKYPKGTIVTIAPASDSALYYSVDGGSSYKVSDVAVAITLDTAGVTISIDAYCVNQRGTSATHATQTIVVQGVSTPQWSQESGSVTRGGSVTISPQDGGTLYYSVDGGTEQSSNTSVAIPITNQDSEHPTTIVARNVVDGTSSASITKTFYMAALDAPTMTMSDTTGTANQFPIGGGTVSLSQSQGAIIYYTTDGSTPTASSTQYSPSQPIQVSAAMTIKAIAIDTYGTSEIASEDFTVMADHKFQFKIALTGDNSTEYIPVEASGNPRYTMSIDWGDGTTENVDTNIGARKSVSHQYTGTAGDEFTVTLRGTAIPVLDFGNNTCCNKDALVEILDNTLDCDTNINFAQCSNLRSISANALQNNIKTLVAFIGTALTSLPDGLLSHLTKAGVHITSCKDMFNSMAISLSASQMNELKGTISHVTNFESMFYGMKASVTIPDDFFDDVQDNSVTRTWAMTQAGGNYVSGDAKKLYDVLSTKMVFDYQSNNVSYTFSATGLSNRDQVPTTWGGTMS